MLQEEFTLPHTTHTSLAAHTIHVHTISSLDLHSTGVKEECWSLSITLSHNTCMCAHMVLCIYVACMRCPLLSLLVLYKTEG